MSAPLVGRLPVKGCGVMPKEMIRTKPEPGEDRGAGQGPPVFVGWAAAGEVRLATLDPRTLHDGPGIGYYATLTRGDLNRLIRVLRRARDQAFGRDE